MMPGQLKGRMTRRKTHPGRAPRSVAASIRRGSIFDREIDRQRHEQGVDVDEAEIDRPFVIDEPGQRLADQAGRPEQFVDRSGPAEDG